MTSNTPFFSNFLAAFRAQSASIQKAAAGAAPAASQAAAHVAAPTTVTVTSTPGRTITSKARSKSPSPGPTTAAVQATTGHHHGHHHTHHHHHARPHTHHHSFQASRTHTPPTYTRSTSPSHTPLVNPKTPNFPTAISIPGRPRDRRGSDSSSDSGGGFKEVLGGEKWYIGGRTAAGEERFYKLGLVRRERSVDRLSLDRLSV